MEDLKAGVFESWLLVGKYAVRWYGMLSWLFSGIHIAPRVSPCLIRLWRSGHQDRPWRPVLIEPLICSRYQDRKISVILRLGRRNPKSWAKSFLL